MKNIKRLVVLKGIAWLLLWAVQTVRAEAPEAVLPQLSLPPGFSIDVYADKVPNARSLALGDDGTVYVGSGKAGKVYAVRDADHDGRAEQVFTLASGLTLPNGVVYHDGALYVAEVSRLLRFDRIAAQLADPPEPRVVYDWFPTDLHHGWKYMRLGPDGKLYIPVGAPCNICRPEKEIYASLTRLKPDGSDFEIYAKGIRNTVGFDWHPDSGELFFTDNGRDWLGDDLPADELNQAPKAGMNFGYPYCHGGDTPDPEFGNEASCDEFTAPAWRFPAHVAPLGIRFYRGDAFPPAYRQQLFVAQHGSWNRSVPHGYRIVVVKFQGGKPVADEVFAEGWLDTKGRVWGRPVDILELADGSLLVSDDSRGVLYRIRYQSGWPIKR